MGKRSRSRKDHPWPKALAKAKENLGITGFAAPKRGTPLHDEAMAIMEENKWKKTASRGTARRARSRRTTRTRRRGGR